MAIGSTNTRANKAARTAFALGRRSEGANVHLAARSHAHTRAGREHHSDFRYVTYTNKKFPTGLPDESGPTRWCYRVGEGEKSQQNTPLLTALRVSSWLGMSCDQRARGVIGGWALG
ncbi:unnamed protein product [Prunus armeniaca]|uniref:Uncharacterized protein n=1 Tax=Prunus armeniaca TaxID=36596 RepID=A0A6J5VBI6_PRUAR|nr:unnamed protein product [Prunus armeniaca]